MLFIGVMIVRDVNGVDRFGRWLVMWNWVKEGCLRGVDVRNKDRWDD